MSKLKKEDLSLVEENKDDFRLSVIRRKNLTNEFTIESIENHLKTLRKMEKEGEASISLAESMVDNIERNNKDIKKIPTKKKHAIWLWYENKGIIKEIEPQLKAVKDDIKIHEGYLDTIYEKFGFVKSDINEKDDGEKESNKEGAEGSGATGSVQIDLNRKG